MNLSRLGRWEQAVVVCGGALAHSSLPSCTGISVCTARERPVQARLAEHEWRFKCPDYVGSRVNRTFWNGDHFRGRSILLHAEQGYGDTLQFIRFAPMVKRRGGRVVVQCPASLLRLVARCDGVDMAVDASSFVPDCQITAPMLRSAIFGTTMATVPASALSGDRPDAHRALALRTGSDYVDRPRPRCSAGRDTQSQPIGETVPDRDSLAGKPRASCGSLEIVPPSLNLPRWQSCRASDWSPCRPNTAWISSVRGPGGSGHAADRPAP